MYVQTANRYYKHKPVKQFLRQKQSISSQSDPITSCPLINLSANQVRSYCENVFA